MSSANARYRIPLAARAAALLAAILLGLGSIGLLQVAAWTGMAFDYGARYGLTKGLDRTFDGKHPCPLCKQISLARQSDKESKPAVTLTLTPIKLACAPATVGAAPHFVSPSDTHVYFDVVENFTTRSDRPASPPPRNLAA